MLSIADFSKSSEFVAVCVGKEKNDFTHCGILYTLSDGDKVDSYFLHLGDPMALQNKVESEYVANNSHYRWKPLLYPSALAIIKK